MASIYSKNCACARVQFVKIFSFSILYPETEKKFYLCGPWATNDFLRQIGERDGKLFILLEPIYWQRCKIPQQETKDQFVVIGFITVYEAILLISLTLLFGLYLNLVLFYRILSLWLGSSQVDM